MTLLPACAPAAPNSSARWPSTRTNTSSATCEAPRASSWRWPGNSPDAFTAFEEAGGAPGTFSTRSHGWARLKRSNIFQVRLHLAGSEALRYSGDDRLLWLSKYEWLSS